MYFCKHCGFTSRDENIKWCNNHMCRNYGMPMEKKYDQNMYGQMREEMCAMPQVPCNDQLQLAFATVPFQKNTGAIYPAHDALMAGTIFPQLNMPWKSRIRRR